MMKKRDVKTSFAWRFRSQFILKTISRKNGKFSIGYAASRYCNICILTPRCLFVLIIFDKVLYEIWNTHSATPQYSWNITYPFTTQQTKQKIIFFWNSYEKDNLRSVYATNFLLRSSPWYKWMIKCSCTGNTAYLVFVDFGHWADRVVNSFATNFIIGFAIANVRDSGQCASLTATK